jgi:plastocyanin
VLVACGGGEQETATPEASPSPAAGGQVQPAPGGKVITVEMLTDEKGNNLFRPNAIDADEGDVLRFTLVSGVHNVHFPADSNRAEDDLPAASNLLQLPGQTYDVLLDWEEGQYFFQCDPHALLGMVGRLTIRDKD